MKRNPKKVGIIRSRKKSVYTPRESIGFKKYLQEIEWTEFWAIDSREEARRHE